MNEVPEEEILFQSPLNDFYIVDVGDDGIIVKITTKSGELKQGYASSIKMNSFETALFTATKVALHELKEMPMEQVKDILRRMNPKIHT